MKLSVIIPSYNHSQFVVKTLRAAEKIPVKEKEILVIDDGSSDHSASVIQEYISQKNGDTAVKLIARENRGLVKTLNEGLQRAQGEYIYITASDDIPIASGIKELCDVLDERNFLRFAMGNALFMDSEEQTEFRLAYGNMHQKFFSMPPETRQKEMYLRYPQPILLQATIIRKSVLQDMGGWREDIRVDDFSIFLRLFSKYQNKDKDFAFLPKVIVSYYRQHSSNISKNIGRQFRIVEQALDRLCPAPLREEALFRNFTGHTLYALLKRKPGLTIGFFASTVRHLGWKGFARGFWEQGRDAILCRVQGREKLVHFFITYEPATAATK